jgi:DnaJ-class molecular chaperone
LYRYDERKFHCIIAVMAKEKRKITCGVCGGTGQVSYFKGVSRFLLSTDECDECAGTGFRLDTSSEKGSAEDSPVENTGKITKK